MSSPTSLVTVDGNLITSGLFYGKPSFCICDRKCEKAWGISSRNAENKNAIEFDENEPDDIAYLPDHEVGIAPRDPGTYEGCGGVGPMSGSKPWHPTIHNKWCYRECERSEIIAYGEALEVRRFDKPRYNMPSRHGEVILR